MPNGGSDCCSTCWFNKRNKGEAFCENPDDLLPDFCNIRALPIEDPVYTYCANHPRRRPEHDSIPIGPVFTGDPTGFREVWRSSPDTDEVRNHLLSLLAEIAEQPESEYPIGVYVDEVVVWQLGEFREMKAIPQLQRLASFDPVASETGSFGRTRRILVSLLEEARAKIEGGST